MPYQIPDAPTYKEITAFLYKYYKHNELIPNKDLMDFFGKVYKERYCYYKIARLVKDGYIERTDHKIDKLYKVLKVI